MVDAGRIWSGVCLCLSVACAYSCAGAPRGIEAPSPAAALNVERYYVLLELDIPTKSVRGETTLDFGRPLGAREVRFPSHALVIDEVTSAERALPFRVLQDQLVISLSADTNGEIRVRYHGRPKQGLVFGERYVYTDFHTCHWMICNEEPGDKAALRMELVLPEVYQVVASGELASRSLAMDGRQHSLWSQERPYSPYLFGFAAGEFSEVSQQLGPTNFRYLGLGVESGSLLARFADSGRMLEFLREKAGVPLPIPTYTQVLVPGSQAQEKSSFSLIGREELDPILEDPHEDWVISHELSHQWWGNLITCKSWQHFWLNEGLATFMVAAYKEQRWGKAAYDRELALFAASRERAAQAGFDVPLAYAGSFPTPRLKRSIVYAKGAQFLHVLRERLGDAQFWQGLRLYTRRYAGGVVESRDFQNALEESSGQRLAELFDVWVYPRESSQRGAAD